MQEMKPAFAFLLYFLLLIGICNAGHDLKMKYYHKSCPSAEAIVRDITWSKVAANPSLAAKLLRLHYHDCFVRATEKNPPIRRTLMWVLIYIPLVGCDASVLLDSTKTNAAEKSAPPNRSLSGYDVIDDIKMKLEEECPGIVSCADIVALSARDAVSYQYLRFMNMFVRPYAIVPTTNVGSFHWEERWEDFNCLEATANLPSASANFTILLQQFKENGLDLMDLVTLSGAHTIGVTHRTLVARRLYNFTGKGDLDPSLNLDYAKTLRILCPNPINPTTVLEMDPQSSLSFDGHYYRALNQDMGILRSDAALLTDPGSAQIARVLQHDRVFFAHFAQSMKKMGAIGVLTNGDGEIRKNCRVLNA